MCRLVVLPRPRGSLLGTAGWLLLGWREGVVVEEEGSCREKDSSCLRSNMDLTIRSMLLILRDQRRRGRGPVPELSVWGRRPAEPSYSTQQDRTIP